MRNSFAPDSDGDFGPTNIVRTVGRDSLRTMTLETRLDSEWTDQISTLVGLFYSNEATRANVTDTISLVHPVLRSEEHTSELQSLMRISYAVFCLKKNTT